MKVPLNPETVSIEDGSCIHPDGSEAVTLEVNALGHLLRRLRFQNCHFGRWQLEWQHGEECGRSLRCKG